MMVLFPRTDSLPPTGVQGFAARVLPLEGSMNVIPPEPATGAPSLAEMQYGIPEEIEVFVRILTDEGASMLEARERGQLPSSLSWWDIVDAHSQVHTRRIRVRAIAL